MYKLSTCLLFLPVIVIACHANRQVDDPQVWQKIKLDFRRLDDEGLAGPPNGKVAVNYEFCIPADEKSWRMVRKIDPTATKNMGAGRSGCKKDEWLIIGNTHQKHYKKVLYDLARQEFVREIRETFWE